MISACEAKCRTKAGSNTVTERLLEKLEAQIIDTADRGYTHITEEVRSNVNKDLLVATLESLGYNVKFIASPLTDYVRVDWKC